MIANDKNNYNNNTWWCACENTYNCYMTNNKNYLLFKSSISWNIIIYYLYTSQDSHFLKLDRRDGSLCKKLVLKMLMWSSSLDISSDSLHKNNKYRLLFQLNIVVVIFFQLCTLYISEKYCILETPIPVQNRKCPKNWQKATLPHLARQWENPNIIPLKVLFPIGDWDPI